MLRKQRGFTLVELMVTVAVLAILASLAMPMMRVAIANSRVRAASESIQNGLAQARAEAIRLNTRVEFVLAATGWQVRRVSDGTVLSQSSGKESSSGLQLTKLPATADRVTYNAFGLVPSVNPSNGSAPITRIGITVTIPPSSSSFHPLAVQLIGGSPRSCDPAAASTEPKSCL
jgi:type IV fimbrial biogenesis protein FimT